ncbi:hypothetical protein EDB86DRAFT_2832652 [Lactarius hatsudake]|nr:hypothetical protein EDB86DRAFT_2832652 [Lactarius hatsudake]
MTMRQLKRGDEDIKARENTDRNREDVREYRENGEERRKRIRHESEAQGRRNYLRVAQGSASIVLWHAWEARSREGYNLKFKSPHRCHFFALCTGGGGTGNGGGDDGDGGGGGDDDESGNGHDSGNESEHETGVESTKAMTKQEGGPGKGCVSPNETKTAISPVSKLSHNIAKNLRRFSLMPLVLVVPRCGNPKGNPVPPPPWRRSHDLRLTDYIVLVYSSVSYTEADGVRGRVWVTEGARSEVMAKARAGAITNERERERERDGEWGRRNRTRDDAIQGGKRRQDDNDKGMAWPGRSTNAKRLDSFKGMGIEGDALRRGW